MGNNILKIGAVSQAAQSSADLQNKLTPRQLDVLALLCEGLPNKLIARRLNISAGTVKVHVVHIHRALGVSSRLQAVVEACNLGFNHKVSTPAIAQPASRIAPILSHPVGMRLQARDDNPLPLLATLMSKRLDAVVA